ncbi:MFS transporter [Actinokineospora auranticolor]|uniref:Putative MFS family arabinose efflux permease n=1 Tax=Actinokineospora auranticolor TaxID=155976 RepID=A0A2S6GK34_9PSEU|nr:MFS transporter [Actinokineospora auranticolor]PPK65588.1 putative MFS family arabinose efflux permease [Actinokineospora auranticolor]
MRETLHNLGLVRRDRVFRRFWLGMLISRTGDAFTTVALSWLVLTVASPADLGVVLLCFGLPRVLSAPIAGRLLDRAQPRVLLGWDNALRGVLIGLVPLLHATGVLRVPFICVIAACAAVLSALTEVAEGALVPRLVADGELEAANSLLGMNWEIAYIAGPPLSGLLVAWIGAPTALVVDALSFGLMSALCFGLPENARGADAADGDSRGLLGKWLGVGALVRLPAVLVLTASTVGFLFLQGMSEVFFPVYSRTGLTAGPGGYGVLVGAAGAGALLGVLFGPSVYGKLRPHLRMSAVLVVGAPLFAALALVDSLVAGVVLIGLATFLWGPYYVFERSLAQRLTPDGVRGRVMGARTAVTSVGFPLGSLTAGWLFAHADVGPVILAMAGGYAALGLLPLLSRSLRDTAPSAPPAQVPESR